MENKRTVTGQELGARPALHSEEPARFQSTQNSRGCFLTKVTKAHVSIEPPECLRVPLVLRTSRSTAHRVVCWVQVMLVNLRMYRAGMVFCVGISGNIGTSLKLRSHITNVFQQHLEFTETFQPSCKYS